MSSEWERPGRVERFEAEMEALKVALDVGAVELSDKECGRLALGAIRLAGVAAEGLDWPNPTTP